MVICKQLSFMNEIRMFVRLCLTNLYCSQGKQLCDKRIHLLSDRLSPQVLSCLKRANRLPTYTGCHRRNGPNFGRVFLMINYTDITQNTYIQSWTFTEIIAIEKCGHLAFPHTVRLQLCSALTVREQCGTHFCDYTSSAQRDKIAFHYCRYVQCLVTLRTTEIWVECFCSSI